MKAETLRDVVTALKSMTNKTELISYLRRDLGLDIPVNVTYIKIVEAIEESGKEQDFCERFIGAKNFDEAMAKYRLIQALTLLRKDQLLAIAKELSAGKGWEPNDSTYGTLIQSITSQVTAKELENQIQKLLGNGTLPPLSQRGEWVIGPLGVTRSVCRRKPMDSEYLIKFFEENFSNSVALEGFADNIPDGFLLKQSEPSAFLKLVQLILTHKTTPQILRAVNQLIADEKIRIAGIKRYWSFVATPCGVFERKYRGAEYLAEILQIEFEEPELSATAKLRSLERCIKEKPDEILNDLFGIIDLWRIGKNMGLVNLNKMEKKQEVIKLILLKLGFNLPPELRGLITYEKFLDESMTKLMTPKPSKEQLTGIMMDIYSGIESVLKDLIYFHISFFWADRIEQCYGPEEKKKVADSIVREKFKVEKNPDSMGLGPLISLLRQFNTRIKSENQLRQKLKDSFQREYLISREQFNFLNAISPLRSIFGHDIREGDRRKEVGIVSCKEIVDKLKRLVSNLETEGVYPHLIRITREVTDEYGTWYLEAMDENDKEWIVMPKGWLQTEFPYFMHSTSGEVAVDPIIIPKFW